MSSALGLVGRNRHRRSIVIHANRDEVGGDFDQIIILFHGSPNEVRVGNSAVDEAFRFEHAAEHLIDVAALAVGGHEPYPIAYAVL